MINVGLGPWGLELRVWPVGIMPGLGFRVAQCAATFSFTAIKDHVCWDYEKAACRLSRYISQPWG